MKIIKFLVFIFLSSCSPTSEPHVNAADEIINKYSNLVNSQGLKPFGTGGEFSDNIKKFSLTYKFYSKNKTDVEKAREKIVFNVELLLDVINKEINKQYLNKFPHDENNLYFVILFSDLDGKRYCDLGGVYLYDGTIFYATCDEEYVPTFIFKETYAEAYEKVYGVPLPDRTVQYGTRD